ncbi:MAG: 3-hydroxyacyl-CoA dehydrogenase family protein [Dysgonamonadaceae bacterium]|jgi:3-hydroxybutyryl-CoA dehydrogenase|nr:3-hydroxyacyl-CoA dehydrogenase family protein [Dysgonamonadaceae bacterium]
MSEPIIEPIENFGLSTKDRNKSLFSKIGVVGCGKDGRNIVRLTASAGLEVTFIEISQEKIDFALEKISQDLDTKIESWGLTPGEKKTIMGRINGSLNYASLKDCDFVIECVRYDDQGARSTQLRKDVFKTLESVLSPDAIIATNATTVIISELAAELQYKERCISLHFPVAHPDAKILEIVKGMYTSNEVYNKVLLFAKLIKYDTIDVHESNGLVSLRLMVVMLNEACQMLMENVSAMESIDRLFEVVYGMRVGIFRMADIIGIEKLVSLMEDMFNEYGDKKYKPSPVLWRLYRTNQTGVATGKGFYVYENGQPVATNCIN